MTPQQLKPCPFCGGKPAIVTRDVEPQGDPWYGRKEETFVLCDCGACMFDEEFHEGFYDAETRAVAAWNRRAQLGAVSVPAEKASGARPQDEPSFQVVAMTSEMAEQMRMADPSYTHAAHGITGGSSNE